MSDGMLIVLVTLGPLVGVCLMFGGSIVLGKVMGGRAGRRAVQDLPPRAVGRAVVAGSDLEWQLDLNRIYRDYDRYVQEQRLPGERAP